MLKQKELREEFAKLHGEAKAVVDAAAAASRELTADEQTANDTRFARMKVIKGLLDEDNKFASMALPNGPTSAADAKPGDPAAAAQVQTPTDAPGRDEFNASKAGQIIVGDTKIDRAEFSRAVRNWAATGEMDRKFATITTATQSGILLPKTVLAPLVTGALNSYREGFNSWNVMPMQSPGDTSTFNLPVIDPTAGGQVAENAGTETENAPSLGESIVSTVKTYQSGSIYYSNLQLSATSFDLLAATVPHLQFNKELGLESVITAAIIADAGVTQVVATATTGGFTYTNSVSLANKLPKRYQQFKVRLLSAEAFSAAEGLLDDNNRPVMVADPQNGSLKRMHGTPTIRCDYLEAFGASKVVGLEFSLIGFHLRDAGEGIARYTQVPAKPNQTGINLFGYHAYGYAVSSIAKLKTPAS